MADDFDIKYKRQEVGITDKKTGKTNYPYDKYNPKTLSDTSGPFLKQRISDKNLKRLKSVKKVAIPVALGAAAFDYLKNRKRKNSDGFTGRVEEPYLTSEDMLYIQKIRKDLGIEDLGLTDLEREEYRKKKKGSVEGMFDGGSVKGQKAIQVKKKPFRGVF